MPKENYHYFCHITLFLNVREGGETVTTSKRRVKVTPASGIHQRVSRTNNWSSGGTEEYIFHVGVRKQRLGVAFAKLLISFRTAINSTCS